jgi:hypothetical protein
MHDVQSNQVQLNERYAVIRVMRNGDVNKAEVLQRLSRLPHGVWTGIDPERKLLPSVQVGARALAMAH